MTTDKKIGPDSPDDARPATYWDGRGLVQGSASAQRVDPAVPWGAAGEALPALDEGEVEIVMIGMRSVMGDVVSVRALREGDKIRYRVVDEYEECDEEGKVIPRYNCEPEESSAPLTLEEVKSLLWSIHVEGYGQIFEQAWREQMDGHIDDYENDFYFMESDFYSRLQEWLERQFKRWKGEQPRPFRPDDKIVCTNDDFRSSMSGISGDRFQSPQGLPRKGGIYCVSMVEVGEKGAQGLYLVGLSTFLDGREVGFNSTRFRL